MLRNKHTRRKKTALKWEPRSSRLEPVCSSHQVRTSWQWHRHLLKNLAAGGHIPLRLNLDETSIRLNYDGDKGVVSDGRHPGFVMVNKKSKGRGTISHAVLVCDDSSIQPKLPQLIIGNEHILRVQDLNSLKPHLPANIVLVRAESSWIKVELLIVLLEMLRQILDAHKISKVPVLLLDCCQVHCNARVWKTAKRLRILLCFVPARLTWLVQPLDVRILRRLKAFLRAQYRSLQLQNERPDVSVVELISILIQGIRKVLQGKAWSSAFDECGYSSDCSKLSSSIRCVFGQVRGAGFHTLDAQPSQEQLLAIMPKKRSYDFGALLWNIIVPTHTSGHEMDVSLSHDVQDLAGGERFPSSSHSGFPSRCHIRDVVEGMADSIALRTRSRSRLSVEPALDSPGLDLATGLPSGSCLSSTLGAATQPMLGHRPARARARPIPMPSRPRLR